MAYMNHVDRPNKLSLTEVMRKVNAYGHAPRVIVELDKFVYVPGLKKKYDVIEYVTKETVTNIVSIVNPTDDGGSFHMNMPVMPIEGKNSLNDMVITSRHRTVNPQRPKHKGLDLDLAIGDPVVSVWDGKVTEVNFQDRGYGYYVTVDHGNGVKTRYAHLNAPLVSVGQIVKAGQRVGLGGNTGDVKSSGGDGSHLHFEVWKDGVDINPEPVLKGELVLNGVSVSSGGSNGTGSATTITKTTEQVSYVKDFTQHMPDSKIIMMNGSERFMASTPVGGKRIIGFQGIQFPNQRKVFVFRHQWFNDGYLSFSYFYQKASPNDRIQILMDGSLVWTLNGSNSISGVAYPAPITVPRGDHTFEFVMTSISPSQSKWGLMSLKAAEFKEIHEQVVVPSTNDGSFGSRGYRSTVWDYEDDMGDLSKWEVAGAVGNGGDYFKIDTNGSIVRSGQVTFPFSTQFSIKVDPTASLANVRIANGQKAFIVGFKPNMTVSGSSSYVIDNTDWQEYMLVVKNENDAILFVKQSGVWTDTGIDIDPIDTVSNVVQFYVVNAEAGSMYVDYVKYADLDFSSSAPTTKVEMKTTPKWYELGGFVYDETFYLEEDIIEWEVSTHLDMSSATARVTLSNHHGLYSPEYVRDPVFPENMRPNPYTYYENGEIRHVISEYTPIRIYAGYGDQVVRVFTGMIKGEIEEDSESRTITFNCIDRFDLLEECVLLKEMSFPPAEAFNGDSVPRPWIKSSIVQALANHAGMTGWRYVYEDLLHPDLVIEETYYTDINQRDNTFMRFNSKGVLERVTLDVKTPNGYKNPFVEAIVFSPGERVSDCIRRIVDEINFRVYCNRYGTFVMHRLDFENNMRWDFRSGENLYELNSSTDYSRVRNHIIVTGSKGNQEHFFDKDLLIATKGHIRTTQINCPWIDESDGTSAYGAKKVVADKLFFDMKRQARTKEVVVKGNPFIEVLDGCYVYDANTSTAGYYIIKGNTLIGNQQGMINRLELTWEEKVA